MRTIFLVGALVATTAGPVAAEDVKAHVRDRITAAGEPPVLTIGDEVVIHTAPTVCRFYLEHEFDTVWVDDERPRRRVTEVLSAVRGAARDGLRPANYHQAEIEAILGSLDRHPRAARASMLADLELLVSDAFLLLASHHLAGVLDPESIDPEWIANRRGMDFVPVLSTVARKGRVSETLAGLLPKQSGYRRLRESLAEHRALAERGGWPRVSGGATLRPGDRSERVLELRRRLADSAGEPAVADSADVFDAALAESVARFQARHGLEADGLVGSKTLAALNTPIERRIRQILVNLERWRWLPESLGDPHVLVNIADFHLDVMERGEPILTMRVIVGRPYRRTPVFSGELTYLVLNPTWEVPPSIAVKDILPKAREDPDFFARTGTEVLSGWGGEDEIVDPASVDWQQVPTKRFPYRFRQRPGPLNALGRIKFMFPNRFSVYLHDTPARELFGKTERIFSSGCIRIAEPLALAEYLLTGSSWNTESIQKALDTGKEQTVRLPKRVPVHLLYWTAWVAPDGTVQFRDDVYDRDERVALALKEPAPTAEDLP